MERGGDWARSFECEKERAVCPLLLGFCAWHAPCFTNSKEVTPYVHEVAEAKEKTMVTLTLLVIILVVLLIFGGGGFWYRGRGR